MRRPKNFLKSPNFINYLRQVNISTYLKYKGLDLFGAIRTHKKKFILGTMILGGYYKKKELKIFYDKKIIQAQQKIQEVLAKDSYIDKQLKTVVKQTIVGTFKDDHVQQEGIDYLENIIKDKQSIQGILDVILQILKEKTFEDEGVELSKKIAKQVINNKQIEQETIKLFIRIFDDPEVKFELGELVKQVLTDSDTKKALVQLFIDAFQEPPVKVAVKNVLTTSFYDIIMDPETAEKFRVFTYNFFQTYQNTDDKSLLDLIIKKVVQKGSKEEIDLDKFFKNIQQNKEDKSDQDLEEIWKNSQKLYDQNQLYHSNSQKTLIFQIIYILLHSLQQIFFL